MQPSRIKETESRFLPQAYRFVDSVREVGEAAWEKLSGVARSTYERLRDETSAGEVASTAPQRSETLPSVQAPPVGRGPSGVDIIASAAPPEAPPEMEEPAPAIIDEETQDVERMAPIGSEMAKDMLRKAQGE